MHVMLQLISLYTHEALNGSIRARFSQVLRAELPLYYM